MATAKAHASLTLELNPAEASTLLYILRNIGGDPTNTARRHVDTICSAMSNAGITAQSSSFNPIHVGSFDFNKEIVS